MLQQLKKLHDVLDCVFGYGILRFIQVISDKFVALDCDLGPVLGLAVVVMYKGNDRVYSGLDHKSLLKLLIYSSSSLRRDEIFLILYTCKDLLRL